MTQSFTIPFRRRHLLSSAAIALTTLATPFRSAQAMTMNGELLHLDFLSGVATLRGRKTTVSDLVEGPCRLVDRSASGGLFAGLLCESAQTFNPAHIRDSQAPENWRFHPSNSAISVSFSNSGTHSVDVRLSGKAEGVQLLIFGADQGLDVDAGTPLRFGATVNLVEGAPPEQLTWGIIEGGTSAEPAIFHHVPMEIAEKPFIDRHFIKTAENKKDLHLACGFVADGPVDFTIRVRGLEFTKNENFRFASPVVPDRNRLKETADYFASAVRVFELSGLGPVYPGGILYSEIGSAPLADHLIVGVGDDFHVYLRMVSNGKEIAHVVLGEAIPLQPWKLTCTIDSVRGSLEARWCGRLVRTSVSALPDAGSANLGFFEDTCAECILTAVRLAAGNPGDRRSTSAGQASFLYDDFERAPGRTVGEASTGHRWMKSLPPGAPDFAISNGSLVALNPRNKPIAAYLKTDFGKPPASMGAVVSFESSGDVSAVALISSTPGFPRTGPGGSNAVHNVFATDRAYYGVALDGALIDLGPSRDYPEGTELTGRRYGIGWHIEGEYMTLLLPGGYFHRKMDPRFIEANNRELIYELYRRTDSGSVPAVHAVSAT